LRWPLDLPSELAVGAITLRVYTGDDAPALFAALDDPQVWEHIPRPSRPGARTSTPRSGPSSRTGTG
jgi:RimJ/RimL family protein N-acetyltransferase